MKKENNFIYKFIRVICIILLKVIYRPKVIGKENIPKNGPVIFAGNHKHAADPVMVITSTNRIVHYMAKEDLFKGFHGKIFEKMGLIKVYRGRGNPLAVIEAEKILQTNGTVGIFPEGTRNKTQQEILKFRYGTVIIANKTNSKIVPFAIRGKYRIFRKGIEIEFGKPIEVQGMEKEEANKYLETEVLKLLRK